MRPKQPLKIPPFLERNMKTVKDEYREDFEKIQRIENNGVLQCLEMLSSDAPYYRDFPLRLRPYISVAVIGHHIDEGSDTIHDASYVVQRLECSNVEPRYAIFRLRSRKKGDRLDTEASYVSSFDGWFEMEDPEEEVLFFQTYGPQAKVEVNQKAIQTFGLDKVESDDGFLQRGANLEISKSAD